MEPGSAIGHYRIVRLLGRGGMGEVYEARDERLERSVALKLLPPELAEDRERRARLEREAKAAAALQHPNIVTLFALEEEAGRLFLVMELVDGRPLHELVPPGGLGVERFLELAVALGGGVAAAHGRGIVHRDLKPANVLVDAEGRVRVLDFGLARFDETGAAGMETMGPTEALTGGGQIVGTVAYMSPEQAEGKPVDARTDIFSLGVVLYEMATGERPFTGDTGMSILTSILRDEPVSVTERNARLPRHLGRIVRRCLQKAPGRRYQSALDLRNDLLELREELDSGELEAPAAASRAPRRRWTAVALAAAVAALAALGIGFGIRRAGDGPAAVPDPVRQVRRLVTVGSPADPAISADGRYVAYESDERGLRSLRLHQVGTGSDRALVSAEDWQTRFFSISFSPDQDRIRYARVGAPGPRTLWEVSILGGTPRKLLEDFSFGPIVSPDGRYALVVRGQPAFPAVGTVEVITLADGAVHSTIDPGGALFAADWSPDGSSLVLSLFSPEVGAPRLVLAPAQGGPVETIAHSDEIEAAFSVCWEPDGRALIVGGPALEGGDKIWRVGLDSGATTRLTRDFDDYEGCSLTASGETLATVRSDIRADLWIVPVDRPEEARLLGVPSGRRNGAEGVAWLDEETALYAARDARGWLIWAVDVAGTGARRLTTAPGVEPHAAVVSGRIVFEGWAPDTPPGVYTVEGDGTDLRRVSRPERAATRPALSPDGAWLFYEDLRAEGAVLVRRRWDGTEEAPLVEGTAHLISYSPDGSRLAVHARDADSGTWRTLILSADFELERTLDFHSESDSPWASDDALYVSRTVDGVSNIYRVPVDDPSAEEQVTRFTEARIFAFDVSPDGRTLVVSRGEAANELLLLDLSPAGR